MPHAQALILTPDPSTPAAELARGLAATCETEWSAEAGYVRFGEGLCTFHSWPEGLRLDAFAETGDGLARVETAVAQQLERGGLRVEWRRRPLAER